MERYDVHDGPSAKGIFPGSRVYFQVPNDDRWRGAVPCRIKEISPVGEIKGVTEDGQRPFIAFPYDPEKQKGTIAIY